MQIKKYHKKQGKKAEDQRQREWDWLYNLIESEKSSKEKSTLKSI